MTHKHARMLASAGVMLAIFAAAPASAEQKEFTLDKGHAYIGFEIYHLGYSHTVGQFRDFDGSFLVDEEKPENSRIAFTVKSASVDTNHVGRDNHIRNADYLSTTKFPEMKFVSTGVTMLTPTSGKLHGDFTMLGVTKPLTLDFHMTKDAPYPSYLPNYDELRAVGFEATGQVLRLDYGMDFVGFVGSPTGLAIDIKANFDLVDCAGAPETNVPCHWGRVPGFKGPNE